MGIPTKSSRIRQSISITASVFALTIAGWGFYINQTEASQTQAQEITALASTGGSLFVALVIAFLVSALLSYFIVKRPFSKDEEQRN